MSPSTKATRRSKPGRPPIHTGAKDTSNLPKISNLFPSRYLRTSDLGGRAHHVVIEAVDVEPVGRERELKPVLHFASGQLKPLVLNMTNSRAIAAAYGEETEGWAGLAVELYPAETTFGAEVVPCIRVKIPNPAKAATVIDEEPPPGDESAPVSGEVPF